jgi:hypothetical protein
MSRPSTDITLPSLGLPYGDKLPGGVVHIRPMLTQDEKLLAVTDPSREMQSRMLDSLLGATVKFPNGISAEDLLTTDRLFLFIQLRIVSYGEQYSLSVECRNPACRTRIEKHLNLNVDLPIRWANPDTYLDSLQLTMDNGDNIRFHHMTGREERRVFVEVKRLQKLSPNMKGDPTGNVSLAVRIDAVENSTNGFAADDPNRLLKARAYVDALLASEAWEIRDALDDSSSGYTMMLSEDSCPRCGNVAEMEFTPSADFFRPTRKKSRNDSERTTVSDSQRW